jgi:hypothetical protein
MVWTVNQPLNYKLSDLIKSPWISKIFTNENFCELLYYKVALVVILMTTDLWTSFDERKTEIKRYMIKLQMKNTLVVV